MACFVRLSWAQTGFSKWNTVKALKVLALVMLFMRVSSFIFKVTRWAAFKVRGCHTKNKSKAKCARWSLFLWICVALYTGGERERACGNSSNYEIGTLWNTNLQLLLREPYSCFSQAEESELCFMNHQEQLHTTSASVGSEKGPGDAFQLLHVKRHLINHDWGPFYPATTCNFWLYLRATSCSIQPKINRLVRRKSFIIKQEKQIKF